LTLQIESAHIRAPCSARFQASPPANRLLLSVMIVSFGSLSNCSLLPILMNTLLLYFIRNDIIVQFSRCSGKN